MKTLQLLTIVLFFSTLTQAQNAVDFTLPSVTDTSHFTLSKAKGKGKNKCDVVGSAKELRQRKMRLKATVMWMAGITSIVSLYWPGEIAPPKLKPHSRFVVFNPTIVDFPLLEIAKLCPQAY